MDVSYTNVLEGARQYFQGLPMPSTAITPTENRVHDEQSSNSASADDGRESNEINKSYWSTSNNELRTIEPYPPQPTRVEVPDTRPDDGRPKRLESLRNLTSLTEMQSTNRQQSNQQRDVSKTHSPAPVYQQLNNVSGPSSYNRPIETNNTSSSYPTNDRSSQSTPVIAHRTQYYPRYHHPDITKSAPLPFSRNSNIYNSPQTTVSPSIDPLRQLSTIDSESTQVHQQSTAYRQTSSELPRQSPTIVYRQNNSQNQQQHQQQQQQSTSDSSLIHSSTNPNNSSHIQSVHIPPLNNHQGYIPPPHLPIPSVAPSSQLSHQANHHINRINSANIINSNNSCQNRVGLSNHYQNQGVSESINQQHHHHIKQQQQQSILPTSISNQLSTTSHESNHNLNSSQRQSPHASILHNSHNLTDAQPHSPPYPPPPLSPPRAPSHIMHTSYGSHGIPASYPSSSFQPNIYRSSSKNNNQYPIIGLQPSISTNSNTNIYSHQHNSPKINNNYDVIDSKQIGTSVSQGNTLSYGDSCKISTNDQRNINNHNLPINEVSNCHSNRNFRENQSKTQTIPRIQLQTLNNQSSSSSYVLAPRAPREHSHERIPNAVSAETYYPPYKSGEYRDYKTTIASSHYSCTSSTSTTIMSVVNDTRPNIPSVITVPSQQSQQQQQQQQQSVLDINRRSVYPQQRLDEYKSNDYTNVFTKTSTNQQSQSLPASRVASPQSFPVNGPVIKKRESPLDLSVKTVKTTADSTARDDVDISEKVSTSRQNIIPSSSHTGSLTYANYDNRQLNGSRFSTSSLHSITPQVPVCAPKVDFLPNFNSTPLRHQNNHSENDLRRSTSQQINMQTTQSQSNNPSLPQMSNFKKNSLPTTPLYDNKTGSNNYHVLPERVKLPLKYPIVESINSRSLQGLQDNESEHYPESHSKYMSNRGTLKRLGGPYLPGGSGPNKQPRIDVWKEVFDKQIQDKLTAALALREQQKNQEKTLPSPLPNGTLVSSGYSHTNPTQISENSSCPPNTNNKYPRVNFNEEKYSELKNSRDTIPSPIKKSPSSATGFHPSNQTPYSYHLSSRSLYTHQQQSQLPQSQSQQQQQHQHHQHQQQQQQQQQQHQQQHQQQWQPFHDLPSNTGADKRVLSLLRNSLENKQQREEQLNNKQSILVNHNQPGYSNKIVTPVEPKTNIGRHNLSPFTAASLLERNSNTPPHHHKFHVPRTVDSMTQEMSRSPYGSRVISTANLPAGKEADLNNRNFDISRDNKDDNLAAILAAKIRTKAELKQVGSGQYNCSKPISIPSHDTNDLERAASTSTPQSAASSAGSPPKLTREKTPCFPPRRRLFSRSDEENISVVATISTATTATTAAIILPPSTIPARSSDCARSSSETSVFDFRESDSEGEMPVLERQTLEEMRRDRKQLSKVQPAVSFDDAMSVNMVSSTDLVKIELRENDQVPETDPFWIDTCDKFMEQLRGGDSAKKRGRRKKGIETKIEKSENKNKEINIKTEVEIKPENIKKEIIDNEKTVITTNNDANVSNLEKKIEIKNNKNNNTEVIIKKEIINDDLEDNNNNSDHDSDELPLITRTSRRKVKKEDDESDGEDIISKKRRGSRIKLESTSGSESSSDESNTSGEPGIGSSVAHRLRLRKKSGPGIIENEGMKLRSREMQPQKIKQIKELKTPVKNTIVQKPKPKPLFGDGSDFRPGWEEEVYVYKKSLRMPTQLINVSKPSRFHRLSTSLPDLDPDSPALSVSMDSTDVCLEKRVGVGGGDSDIESNCSFTLDEEGTSSTTILNYQKINTRQTRSDKNSIVDLLAKKVGGGKKDLRKKFKEKLEKNATKTLPKGSNEPELLPTPSFTSLINDSKTTLNGKSPIKNNKTTKPINMVDSLLGYFRKETVNNFRDTFKNNHALPNEFSTYVLKSRTRTETKVLKKQATIREVFGEDRPASAPPMQNHAGDTSQDDDSQTETKESLANNPRTLRQKVVSRLRNVGILRSHKAIINSKRHLLTVQRRKSLLKSLTDKKLKNPIKNSKDIDIEDEPIKQEDDKITEQDTEINDDTETGGRKKIKIRGGRKKFRSGFDYIRKKKKPIKKDNTLPKERKRQMNLRTNAECVADLQTEIRTWVIKKGVGETILHRAARLGYTDVAAYCLEKLNNAPSPKDNAGYTPLHEACSRGHLEIAKLLLAYGANVSESANGGIRPLHEAAENGATELVRLLLSYGADPLLATYAGQTPLMLAVDTDAYSILEQHLGDVQGHSTTPWKFHGPSSIFDPEETGFNPMKEPPASSPEPELDDIEIEVSDINLPVLFSLADDPDKWVLLSDLMSALRIKSRDALLRQINPKAPSGPPTIAHRNVMKELKLPDFLDQSRCCHLLSAGERINVRASKVALIKYNDQVKSLLNVESVVINLS